jgi:protein gp37
VREQFDLVTAAKREARLKNAAKKGSKRNGTGASGHPARPLSEKLRNCPDSERMAMIEAEVAAFNKEIRDCLTGYRLQLVPVTEDSSKTHAGARDQAPAEMPAKVIGPELETEVNSPVSLSARVNGGTGFVELRAAPPKVVNGPHPVTASALGALLPSLIAAQPCNGDCRSCDQGQNDANLATDPACDLEKLKDISVPTNGVSRMSSPRAQTVIFRPWSLYTLPFGEMPPTIFRVPAGMDPLSDSTWMRVMLEHIEVFRRDGRHILAFTTDHLDALHELNGRVLARYSSWPSNVRPGISIRRTQEFGKIAKIASIRPTVKWVSFESWQSDQQDKARILDEIGLGSTLQRSGIGWVVAGGSKSLN